MSRPYNLRHTHHIITRPPRVGDVTGSRTELRLSVTDLESKAGCPVTHYYVSEFDDLEDWLLSLRPNLPSDTTAG